MPLTLQGVVSPKGNNTQVLIMSLLLVLKIPEQVKWQSAWGSL